MEPATREEVARALGMPLPRLLHFLRLARAPGVVAEGGRDTGSEGSGLMTTSMKVRETGAGAGSGWGGPEVGCVMRSGAECSATPVGEQCMLLKPWRAGTV